MSTSRDPGREAGGAHDDAADSEVRGVLEPADITAVIGPSPAAVLLVDLRSREVVHANPVAQQLAPDAALPLSLDAWADAAELRDVDGAPLSGTDHPLSRVARSEPVAGQAVSAARRSEMGRRREPLWVIAVPMVGAPMLEDHALVVFLPVSTAGARDAVTAVAALAQADQELDDLTHTHVELRDRAIFATGLSFTVADAQAEDRPLVWVNPAFTTTTGYTLEESVGRNCRFLQGPGTDPDAVRAMSEALGRGEGVSTTLLNHRKDGLAFWNQIDISPIHGPDGVLTHFVGIQTDVTNRVDADRARDRALESERSARAEAEVARSRLAFMVEAVNRLSGTLDVEESRRRLIDLVLPELADWVLVLHVDDRGDVTEVDAAHRDPAQLDTVRQLAARLPGGLHRGAVVDRFLQGQDVRRISGLESRSSLADRSTYLADVSLTDVTAQLGGHSAMFVALPGRRTVDDLMILVRGADRAPFSDEDLDVGRDLGRRVGLILDNARLYQVQARIAEALQRSLLPDLTKVPGMSVAARYQASAIGAEVGGDFYEILDLPDDGVGVAVGDVVGHDVIAAAAMGHLKGLLRACAYEDSASPAGVLERVDHLVAGLGMPTIATVLYARLEPDADGWRLTWSNAGHPPLVVRHPDGEVEMLLVEGGGANDILLGATGGVRRDTSRQLAPGTTVIGYTDGLVERREESIDQGLERLRLAVASAPTDVDDLCDHLLAELGDAEGDDIALIALHLADPREG